MIPLIPETDRRYCDYAFCSVCKTTVQRGVCDCTDDEYEDPREIDYFPVYRCKCTGQWWIDPDFFWEENDENYQTLNQWKFCCRPAIYPFYFDWHHKTYFRFLEQHLSYLTENRSCNCFWPQVFHSAADINNLANHLLYYHLDTSKLDNIRDTFQASLALKSRHGFLSGLLTHTFFYSHFRTVLSDLDQHCFFELPNDYENIHHRLISTEEKLQKPFIQLYTTA